MSKTSFRSIPPGLRSIFALFALTTCLATLRVVWAFDEAPELSLATKTLTLMLGALLNASFYGTIAYFIYKKSSRVRYGYSALTLISFIYYTVIAFAYYIRTGSLEHTDFNSLFVLAPQIFGALLLFNPELDPYFSSAPNPEEASDALPNAAENLA